jgi:hypothetical protein
MVLLICHSFIYLTERIFGRARCSDGELAAADSLFRRHRMLIQADMAEVKTALRAKGII